MLVLFKKTKLKSKRFLLFSFCLFPLIIVGANSKSHQGKFKHFPSELLEFV